jgi:glycogen operon protein
MGALMKIRPGEPYPLGATWDGYGVNFALFSERAWKVELCLFDAPESTVESQRIALPEQTDMVWHGYFPEVRPGQLYGYRVYGPYDAAAGLRFNAKKVLLDPYAKGIGRQTRWGNFEMFGYRVGDQGEDLVPDTRDNAAFAPLAAVVDCSFEWGDDRRPRTPWHETVIYELHVKGFTKLHPEIPERQRGTYEGLANDAAIDHLLSLGVTAVELMPVHHHLDDRHLKDRGLTNYWGYNTLSFFAPEVRYAASGTAQESLHEFKRMVRALHAAGLEVILDVVYNHTAEGNHLGPTLSLRGIDNQAYYRLSPWDPRYYMDFTGTGNTLNMVHPRVLQLIMDSLRYWVLEMRVDGFRFDLASTLARELYEVDRLSSFFDIIHQDPVISQVKLIAEPWDVGEGGYQVGNFPVLWTEWNGRYRDAIRSFWKGEGGTVSEVATRLSGSSDLYEQSGRRPYASINFITCHDGFTLRDLVSYNQKHNEANLEDNRDGSDHNISWNCGQEGPTEDPEVLALRRRQMRNFVSTLFLSQGVPMMLGGDELSHSQQGNNNTYCQDNELSWLDWNLNEEEKEFLEFIRDMVRIRRENPALKRRKFFQGRAIRGSDVKDIAWFEPTGVEMTDEMWTLGQVLCLGMRVAGNGVGTDQLGELIEGDTLLALLSSHHQDVEFTLPPLPTHGVWRRLFDTNEPRAADGEFAAGQVYALKARSVAVFRMEAREPSGE